MRIDGPKVPEAQPKVANTEESRGDKAKPVEGQPVGGEGEAVVVSIGTVASRLTEASPGVSDAVRVRLEEVRTQLGSGGYAIDFDRLAESLLSDEIDKAGA